MTIICGTDFSENAVQAASAAAAIAERVAEPLKLVHVVAATMPEVAVDSLRKLLVAHAEKLHEQFHVAVEPILSEGAADERLMQLAREHDASLLVVAALGTRKHERWLLGSVAERIAQSASVAVLVVRDPASIVAWASGEQNLRVLIGTDLGAASSSALHWVRELRRIRPCDVIVGQVAWPIAEHARFGIDEPMDLDGIKPELRALLERDLRAWAGELPGDGETSFVVRPSFGRVDVGLVRMAEEARADLLVVGTHQHSLVGRAWLGSVSRRTIQGATSNIACVPRAATVERLAASAKARSVLVPTDFSPLANHAVAVGYELLPAGGTVHLLHVITPSHETESRNASDRLRELIPIGAGLRGITTQLHVTSGEAACMAIGHAAARLGVDLICMGTHGRSKATQLLLGSQAEQVLRRVRQPVVLVKDEAG